MTFTFAQPLPVGQTAHLALDFTGELNNKMKGFYRSKYTGLDGKKQYCAVTHFEVSKLVQKTFVCVRAGRTGVYICVFMCVGRQARGVYVFVWRGGTCKEAGVYVCCEQEAGWGGGGGKE